MNKADKIIGMNLTHKKLGEVLVVSKKQKSITMLNVRQIDRGPGWNEEEQRYTGVKRPGGWSRGQNYDFNKTEESHIKQLES